MKIYDTIFLLSDKFECYLIEWTSSAVKVPIKKYISFALNGSKLHVCLSVSYSH